jgi:hypothetical protein
MAGAPLAQIRRRVAELAAPMVGGRSYAYMPDQVAVGPDGALVVVIDPEDTVIEPATLAGTYTYRLRARVIVGSVGDESGQRQLDEKISPDQPGSVWDALETPGGMAGVADYLLVLGAESYGELALGEGRYLSADLVVEVMSNL